MLDLLLGAGVVIAGLVAALFGVILKNKTKEANELERTIEGLDQRERARKDTRKASDEELVDRLTADD